ncbi:hypothetical protein DY000_02046608 [Brassica cretica]|uniref:Uncharacterized protein n=1 Tax=Brassica cretica TaxID=69181 RepID=A0ABQ7F2I9_BRACR|nr:hypothetical protein DY000_02046608 [Brassica cretica]
MSIDYDSSRSIDNNDCMSIDTTDIMNKETNPKTLTFGINVNVAHNKLCSDHDSSVDENLDQGVHVVGQGSKDRPWYADIVNYLAADIEPEELRGLRLLELGISPEALIAEASTLLYPGPLGN